MWYILLNTPIPVGTSRRRDDITYTLSGQTEKALKITGKSTRHGDLEPQWLPKSMVLAIGNSAVVVDEKWILEKVNRSAILAVPQFSPESEESVQAAMKRVAEKIANGN